MAAPGLRRRVLAAVFACCAARALPPRRVSAARALRCRGGAEKKTKGVKKLDPTGTPVAARLLRPLSMLQAKYEAVSEEDPIRGLLVQVGGTILLLKFVEKALKRLGEPTATLAARLAYVAFLALHQAVLGFVEARVEAADDDAPLTLPGNPALAALAKQQAGDGGVAAQLVEKLAARETTVKAYDLDMVAKGRRSQVGSVVVTGFLHLRKGMRQPLTAAVVMGLVSLFREPLVRVHVLGEDVERPFLPPQPAWLKAMQAQQAEQAAADGGDAGDADADADDDAEEGDDDDAVDDDDVDEDDVDDDDELGDDEEDEDDDDA